MSHSQHLRSPRLATRPALLALGLAAAGCGHAPPPPPPAQPQAVPAPPRAQAPRPEPPTNVAAQARAQHAWCDYLDALYQRASKEGGTWSRRDECMASTSTASPEMLERTATCSREALDSFTGDPLTSEYAERVRKCGREALDSVALSPDEIEPYLEAVCRRAETCDQTPYTECRAALTPRLTQRLGRTIGAINHESRARLRECLATVGCEVPIGDRLSGCIEPIMDKLLWLPPDHED
jgi:hypothetical protein